MSQYYQMSARYTYLGLRTARTVRFPNVSYGNGILDMHNLCIRIARISYVSASQPSKTSYSAIVASVGDQKNVFPQPSVSIFQYHRIPFKPMKVVLPGHAIRWLEPLRINLRK